jgi:hypothetical protein
MKILFISIMAIVAPDPAESRKLFIDALALPLKRHEGDDYYFSENRLSQFEQRAQTPTRNISAAVCSPVPPRSAQNTITLIRGPVLGLLPARLP